MDADERAVSETELDRTWAGQELLEEIRQEEMRATIKQWIIDGNAPPRAQLVREIGLSAHRLRLFLEGTALHPHEWDKVAQWCEDKPHPRVSPYSVAIGVLCEWFPPRLAYEARRALALYVRRVYENRKIKIPRYARMEIDNLYPARELPEHP